MDIIIPRAPRKGLSKAAFRDKLTCPGLMKGPAPDYTPILCGAEKWEYVEKLGAYRIRYRCKVCGKTIMYDFSANMNHPYAVFGKNKWRQIVDHWKENKKGPHPY